jgi:Ca2+/Na+ antiporter
MRRRPFQMSLRQRSWLYFAFALTTGSGILWAILWHFFRDDVEMAHPAENVLLKTHLAGAMILLVALGAALPKHASKSWAAKTNRSASLFFVGSIFGTALTGYGILAFFWETKIIHFAHLALGASMVLLLPLHIILGRRLEKRRITQMQNAGRKNEQPLEAK